MPLADRQYLWHRHQLQRAVDTLSRLEMEYKGSRAKNEGEETWDERAIQEINDQMQKRLGKWKWSLLGAEKMERNQSQGNEESNASEDDQEASGSEDSFGDSESLGDSSLGESSDWDEQTVGEMKAKPSAKGRKPAKFVSAFQDVRIL